MVKQTLFLCADLIHPTLACQNGCCRFHDSNFLSKLERHDTYLSSLHMFGIIFVLLLKALDGCYYVIHLLKSGSLWTNDT